jgi:hypothetical protein
LLAGGQEVAVVKMLDQLDCITTDAAATTVEDLFLDIDRETIIATALRARADHFCADPLERDAATPNLVLDRDAARVIDPGV